MNNDIINKTPYLRNIREFPDDAPGRLSEELTRAYMDISNAVNDRTIGVYPTQKASITGESWYIKDNKKQQTLRKCYTFTSTSSINHNLDIREVSQFCRCWGQYNDASNSYGIIWGTSVAIPGQISFYLTKTQIVFVVDGAAPALTSGKIVLEFLSQP